MLPSGSIVKKTAKTAMKFNFLNLSAAAVLLIMAFCFGSVVSSVLYFVTSAFISFCFTIIFFLFVLSPLLFGAFRFYKNAVFGEKQSPAEIFCCFGSKTLYVRAVETGLFITLRFSLSLCIFLIPAFIIKALSEPSVYDYLGASMPSFAPAFSVVAVVLSAIGICFAAIVNVKYYLMPFLAACNDNIPVIEAAKLSKTMAGASLSDFCWLLFSLFGWIVLSILIVPLVFTLPYFFTCYTVHCRFCVTKYNGAVTQKDTAPTFNPKY